MPDHTVLENPKTNLATEIISSDGKTLGKFYFNDNRTPVGYEQLPKNLIEALIATEDARFHKHAGIDGIGTLRALFFLGTKGGASTISQQLAKQLFHRREKANLVEKLSQKIKEPKELSIKESATLVGMFKNSSLYNPRRNPKGVQNRRNVVLHQMEKYDYIDEKAKDSLQQIDLGLKYTPQSHRDGMATYFRGYLATFMKDWIKKNPKPDGTSWSLYNDGLTIYTTIDSRMQQYAEAAVRQHMPRLQAEFFHQNTPERNPTAPFLELDKKEITQLLKRSMKQSERWRHMKYDLKKPEKEIIASFCMAKR
jgi:penicillin-binding protein 1A